MAKTQISPQEQQKMDLKRREILLQERDAELKRGGPEAARNVGLLNSELKRLKVPPVEHPEAAKQLMPWEEDWGSTAPVEEAKQLMPWEEDWGSTEPTTAEQAPAEQAPVEQPVAQAPRTREESMVGSDETALTIGTSLAAQPLAGLYGASNAVMQGLKNISPWSNPNDPTAMERGAQAVDEATRAMTYIPRSEAGLENLEALAPIGEAMEVPFQYAADKAYEATGSPAVGAAVRAAGEVAAGAVAPAKAVKAASAGVKAARKAVGMTDNQLRNLAPIAAADHIVINANRRYKAGDITLSQKNQLIEKAEEYRNMDYTELKQKLDGMKQFGAKDFADSLETNMWADMGRGAVEMLSKPVNKFSGLGTTAATLALMSVAPAWTMGGLATGAGVGMAKGFRSNRALRQFKKPEPVWDESMLNFDITPQPYRNFSAKPAIGAAGLAGDLEEQQ